jgi:hypothetical protein
MTDQLAARPSGEGVHCVESVKVSVNTCVPRCNVTGSTAGLPVTPGDVTVMFPELFPTLRLVVFALSASVPGAVEEVGVGSNHGTLLAAVHAIEPVPLLSMLTAAAGGADPVALNICTRVGLTARLAVEPALTVNETATVFVPPDDGVMVMTPL